MSSQTIREHVSEQNDFSNSESLCCSDASPHFSPIQLTVWEMSFEEFKDGRPGGHLGYLNGPILAILNLNVSPLPPSKFWLNPTYPSWGCHLKIHLGYRNGTMLAVLNFHIAPMPPTKFQLKLTYGFAGDVVWRISRWPLWWPSWISERNDFSNSESPCRLNVSH